MKEDRRLYRGLRVLWKMVIVIDNLLSFIIEILRKHVILYESIDV
jgi:hypothetical protein